MQGWKTVWKIISAATLVCVFACSGSYFWYASLMASSFAQLEAPYSTDCVATQRWQEMATLSGYPNRLIAMIEQSQGKSINPVLARVVASDLGYMGHRKWHFLNAVAMLEIMRKYSQDQKLELAMNHWYMGNLQACQIRGVSTAAKYLYGKSPELLSDAEMATIVAIMASPSYFHPFRNPEQVLARRNYLLEEYHQSDLLGDVEFQIALSEPLPKKPNFAKQVGSHWNC